MVAGTSMGALVGGSELAGKLDELDEFALWPNRRRIFSFLDLKLGGSGLFGGMKLDELMPEHAGDKSVRGSARRRSSRW